MNNSKIHLCDINNAPKKSPTPTKTVTKTPKVTRTVTRSLTPPKVSATQTVTPSITSTPSLTITITPTKTKPDIGDLLSATPTITPTITPSISTSITPTLTPTITPTPSPSDPNILPKDGLCFRDRKLVINWKKYIYGNLTYIVGLSSGARWNTLSTDTVPYRIIKESFTDTSFSSSSFIVGEIVFIDTRSDSGPNISGHYRIKNIIENSITGEADGKDYLELECLNINDRINIINGKDALLPDTTFYSKSSILSTDKNNIHLLASNLIDNYIITIDLLYKNSDSLSSTALPFMSNKHIVLCDKKLFISCSTDTSVSSDTYDNLLVLDEDTKNTISAYDFSRTDGVDQQITDIYSDDKNNIVLIILNTIPGKGGESCIVAYDAATNTILKKITAQGTDIFDRVVITKNYIAYVSLKNDGSKYLMIDTTSFNILGYLDVVFPVSSPISADPTSDKNKFNNFVYDEFNNKTYIYSKNNSEIIVINADNTTSIIDPGINYIWTILINQNNIYIVNITSNNNFNFTTWSNLDNKVIDNPNTITLDDTNTINGAPDGWDSSAILLLDRDNSLCHPYARLYCVRRFVNAEGTEGAFNLSLFAIESRQDSINESKPIFSSTPTVTPTLTQTPTITVTSSITPTPSITATITPSITVTSSTTPTITPTQSSPKTSVPTNLLAIPGNDNVTISWDAPDSPPPSHNSYYLQYKQTDSPSTAFNFVENFQNSIAFTFSDLVPTTLTVSNLKNDIDYDFRICTGAETSSSPVPNPIGFLYSDIISSKPTENQTSPTAPRNLIATNINGLIILIWDHPEKTDYITSGFQFYVVQYKQQGSSAWITHNTLNPIRITDPFIGGQPTINIDKLITNVTYDFRVGLSMFSSSSQSFELTKLSPIYSAITSITPKVDTPSEPINLRTTTINTNEIGLVWDEPLDEGSSPILGYIITINNTDSIDTTISRSILLTSLNQNTDYSIVISAKNSYGPGTPSSPINVKTLSLIPRNPTNVVATINIDDSLAVDISWTQANIDTTLNYFIDYKIKTNSMWTRYETINKDINKSKVSDLIPGSTYIFRIVANSDDGLEYPVESNEIQILKNTECQESQNAIISIHGEYNKDKTVWTPTDILSSPNKFIEIQEEDILAPDNNNLYRLDRSGVWINSASISEDLGKTWTTLPGISADIQRLRSTSDYQIHHIIIKDNNFICLLINNQSNGHAMDLYISNDKGFTFNQANIYGGILSPDPTVAGMKTGSLLSNGPYTISLSNDGRIIFVLTNNSYYINSNILISTNYGSTFKTANNGFLSKIVVSDDGQICIGVASKLEIDGSNRFRKLWRSSDGLSWDDTGVDVLPYENSYIKMSANGRVIVVKNYPDYFPNLNADTGIGFWGKLKDLTVSSKPGIISNDLLTSSTIDRIKVSHDGLVLIDDNLNNIYYNKPFSDNTLAESRDYEEIPSSNGTEILQINKLNTIKFKKAGKTYLAICDEPKSKLPITLPTISTPSSPINLNGIANDSSVDLSWTAPPNNGGAPITNYIIEYKEATANLWNTFNKPISTANSLKITGLTNGIGYVFRVSAVNNVGAGNYSSQSSTIIPKLIASAPGAPTNLVAQADQGAAKLTWVAPINDGGSSIIDYVIEYTTDGVSWTTYPDEVSAITVGIIVKNLISGKTYLFRIAAKNSIGTGSYSNISNPIMPTAIIATIDNPKNISMFLKTSNQVNLAWDPPDDPSRLFEITGYNIRYKSIADSEWIDFNNSTAPFNNGYAFAEVFGLTTGETYHFQIRAIAKNKNTDTVVISNYEQSGVIVVASVSQGSSVAPSAVQNVTTLFASGDLLINWTPPLNAGSSGKIRKYIIYLARETTTGVAPNDINYTSFITKSSQTGDFIPGLANGFYWIKIRAENNAGLLGISTNPMRIYVSNLSNKMTSFPQNFRYTKKGGSISDSTGVTIYNATVDLAWTPPTTTSASISKYIIEYSANDATFNKNPSSIDIIGTATTATLTNLNPKTLYNIRIKAIDTDNKESPWITTQAETLSLELSAPTNLQVVKTTTNEITISWTPPPEYLTSVYTTKPTSNTDIIPIVNYIIEYSEDNGLTWKSESFGNRLTNTKTISSLFSGKVYKIRLKAIFNKAIEGSISSIITAVTQVSVPSPTPTPTVTPTPILTVPEPPILKIKNVSYGSNFTGKEDGTIIEFEWENAKTTSSGKSPDGGTPILQFDIFRIGPQSVRNFDPPNLPIELIPPTINEVLTDPTRIVKNVKAITNIVPIISQGYTTIFSNTNYYYYMRTYNKMGYSKRSNIVTIKGFRNYDHFTTSLSDFESWRDSTSIPVSYRIEPTVCQATAIVPFVQNSRVYANVTTSCPSGEFLNGTLDIQVNMQEADTLQGAQSVVAPNQRIATFTYSSQTSNILIYDPLIVNPLGKQYRIYEVKIVNHKVYQISPSFKIIYDVKNQKVINS